MSTNVKFSFGGGDSRNQIGVERCLAQAATSTSGWKGPPQGAPETRPTGIGMVPWDRNDEHPLSRLRHKMRRVDHESAEAVARVREGVAIAAKSCPPRDVNKPQTFSSTIISGAQPSARRACIDRQKPQNELEHVP